MKNFIHDLEIKNFKSIKHLKTDCKRVNVFIGRPNVGKSNILEAIALLGADHSRDSNKAYNDFIRYEEVSNLFYDDDLQNNVEVRTNLGCVLMSERSQYAGTINITIGSSSLINEILSDPEKRQRISQEIRISENAYGAITTAFWDIHINGSSQSGGSGSNLNNPIRKYHFKQVLPSLDRFTDFLKPPFGSNLFTMVDQNKELREEIASIFDEYGLQFVAYKKEGKFEIEKKVNGYVYKYPYSSMADTFQRLVFYYAAIDSNKDAVLILEEPEVHSYPPYTKNLAERIVESKENQFFITTHSPYILQNLISEVEDNELNVFVTYFENYETKIKCLSPDELKRASGFGIDLFFNLSQFTPHA